MSPRLASLTCACLLACSLTLCGCLFDGAPLLLLKCEVDLDCPASERCVEGYCGAALDELPDVDLEPDVPPTPEPDTPEPEPEPEGCLPRAEFCDGSDNDCDCDIDDDDPDLPPADELCDGIANDCDGLIDEDVEGEGAPCAAGQGGCVDQGELVCLDGAMICQIEPREAPLEVCDGVDNDCDGLVDEGPDGLPLKALCFEFDARFSGVGACAPGLQRCEGGEVGPCEGPVYPTEEVCDGADNDCDGQLDEGVCPEEVGCADGRREAFADLARFPAIAGCSGGWPGRRSLRGDRGEGGACGDDLGIACGGPAALCASGWEICARDGDLNVLRSRIGGAGVCLNREAAGPGRWVAGASHCQRYGIFSGCSYDDLAGCADRGDCSEPICCGDGCVEGGCKDGVFDGGTRIPALDSDGCNAMGSGLVSGVLCCRVQ